MILGNILEIAVFLPGILYLGLSTSYTDLRYGKVKNRDIIIAIIYSFVAYILLLALYAKSGISVRGSYFLEVILNSGIALALGLALWNYRWWTAADAKLFFAFSLLIPLTTYKFGYTAYFQSSAVLINTFIPFLLYIVPKIIFSMPLKDKKENFGKFKSGIFLNILLVSFAATWVTRLIGNILGINLNLFFSILLIYILIFALQKIFKKFLVTALLLLAILRLIFDGSNIMTMAFIKQFLLLSFFLILMYLFQLLANYYFIKEINLKDLRKGMIIADVIYSDKKSKRYRRIDIRKIDSLQPPQSKGEVLMTGCNENGLTENDLIRIKTLHKKGFLKFSSLNVQQTLPFAPFMFLGVLLTLICQGNSVLALKNLIVKFIN